MKSGVVLEDLKLCDSMGLKINPRKSKMLVVKMNQRGSCENARVSEDERQEVDNFNYLSVIKSTDGGMGEEVAHSVLEGRKVWGKMEKLWRN